ncbi:MAG: hypothetical protein ACI8Q9_000708 [Planctomycetota bacterium]|jgi:hypothetical protein
MSNKKHPFHTFFHVPALLGFAALVCSASPAMAQSGPTAGNAKTFALLGGQSVTAAGTGTVVTGDVGVTPGTSITGFPAGAGIVGPHATHSNDGAAIAAQASATALYTTLATTGGATTISPELGGTTISPGTYSFSSSANIAAGTTLTLNGPGTYIFKVGSAITANVHSSVLLTGGANSDSVFWQVTSAATLNGVTFAGTVVAQAAITLGFGACLEGRALTTAAGAVTMAGYNKVSVPDDADETETFYFDDFDSNSDNGWTHSQITSNDDWERDIPNGLSGDPISAFSGAKVWGNNLGLNGVDGLYLSNSENVLRSPIIDCSGRKGVTMTFARWLTIEENQFDQAEVLVNGNLVWSNSAEADESDTAWKIEDIEISDYADNNASVQIEFRFKSNESVVFGGWNLDDFELYSRRPIQGYLNTIDLTGVTTARPGQSVFYRMVGMQPNAPCELMASRTNTGTIIMGHPFDIGSQYRVVFTGVADAQGELRVSFPLPAVMAPPVLYLEVRAMNGNGLDDSNILRLVIQ